MLENTHDHMCECNFFSSTFDANKKEGTNENIQTSTEFFFELIELPNVCALTLYSQNKTSKKLSCISLSFSGKMHSHYTVAEHAPLHNNYDRKSLQRYKKFAVPSSLLPATTTTTTFSHFSFPLHTNHSFTVPSHLVHFFVVFCNDIIIFKSAFTV